MKRPDNTKALTVNLKANTLKTIMEK